MLSDRDENLNTLMLLTGMPEDRAVKLLQHRVRVIASPDGDFGQLSEDVARLLGRTLRIVGEADECDLTLAVGVSSVEPSTYCLALSDVGMTIAPAGTVQDRTRDHVAGITRKICACFATGYVLARLLDEDLPFNTDRFFEMRFASLDLPVAEIDRPLDLGDAALAGGGGVANGFLWGLESLDPIGKLTIIDPKRARAGNANRCLFFNADDDGFKAQLLAERVALPGVDIVPFVGVLNDYVAARADKRLPTLISTADSRAVRRSFQKELPLRVFDASTTDVSEVVVHAHEQPTVHACLSCIYPHVEDEHHRERHIAESLGLSLEEVQAGFITADVAAKLAKLFPTLGTGEALIDTAFDTLQKALCGEGLLKAAPGAQQAAAPFSFVSNLAGLLLALEMYRHQADRAAWSRTNYLVASPWKAPHHMARRLKARLATCEFCANPISMATLRGIWADILP